jgi:hypothetical protein
MPTKRIVEALVLCWIAVGVSSLDAVQFQTLNYFLNTTKGLGKPTSCIAQVKNNTGTFSRTFPYSAGHCPGVPLYIWTKGAPQWGEEHFYSDGSFVKLLDDTGDDLNHPGPLDFLHGLYEHQGEVGLDVMVTGTVNNSVYIDHSGYYVDTWNGNTCPSTWVRVDGPYQGFDRTDWVGTVTGWLYDCRAGRPCQNGPAYPIEVIERTGGDSANADHFWFARWQDPRDGNAWRGLGPVKFWCTGSPGWCAPSSESHFLVDCTVTPVCYRCPPN